MPTMGSRKTDAALMKLVAGGDTAAFHQLVNEHAPRAYRLSYRMLGDASLAEDMVQEACLRLWRQSECWRPDARVTTWLYRVVHNLCIDELRGRQRLSDAAVPEQPDSAENAMTVKHRGQVIERVNKAIETLPVRQRVAVTLVHNQEMGNIEAAEVMGVTVNALESLLVRGRRSLRHQLAAAKEDLIGEP